MFRKLAPGFMLRRRGSPPASEEALLKPFPIHHPYRWYGWWREWGRRLEGPGSIFPSIHDVIDPDYRHPDQPAILNYLRTCRVLAICYGDPPCALNCPSRFRNDGFAFTTDGVWLWPRTLAHDVEHHHVRLPPAMLEHMLMNQYLPQLLDDERESLEISRSLEFPLANPFEILYQRRQQDVAPAPPKPTR